MRYPALLLLFAATAALAQPRPPAAAAAAAGAQMYAVIVGVGDYRADGLTDLNYAVADAEALAKLLTGPDLEPAARYHVRLLTTGAGPESQPTRAVILAALAAMARTARPEDTILFYFSGHGAKNALLPADAARDGTGGISSDQVNTILADSASSRQVLILDACHSGGPRVGAPRPDHLFGGVTHQSGQYDEHSGERLDTMAAWFKSIDGRVTLASCSRDEVSYERPEAGHGVFTYYLLEALSGRADVDGDRRVDALEAVSYVQRVVYTWSEANARRQTPRLMANTSGPILLATLPASAVAATPPAPTVTAAAPAAAGLPAAPAAAPAPAEAPTVIAAAPAPAAPKEPSPEVRAEIERGLNCPDPAEAIKHHNEALRLDPQCAEAYCFRGIARRDLGQPAAAIDDLSRAVTLRPDYDLAWVNRGIIYLNLKEYDKALPDFARSIETNPGYVDPHVWRARLYRERNELEPALQDLTRALELQAECTDARYLRAVTYHQLGRLDDSRRDAEQCRAQGYRDDFYGLYAKLGIEEP